MTAQTDNLMERASQALAKMDYLTCESLSLEALGQARLHADWDSYSRILLPLQEARRQRRMIAAEGVIRLGTRDCPPRITDWLSDLEHGCIVMTHPFDASSARHLRDEAHSRGLFVELLFADSAIDADPWTLRAFEGFDITCEIEAPPAEWRDQWLSSAQVASLAAASHHTGSPADWFLNALETFGDTALTQIDPSLTGFDRLMAMEQALRVVRDHEIIHQRLAELARTLH